MAEREDDFIRRFCNALKSYHDWFMDEIERALGEREDIDERLKAELSVALKACATAYLVGLIDRLREALGGAGDE
ncbi:MAG: hypothetical protein QW815_09305 [Nitrososphaerota archaeon]